MSFSKPAGQLRAGVIVASASVVLLGIRSLGELSAAEMTLDAYVLALLMRLALITTGAGTLLLCVAPSLGLWSETAGRESYADRTRSKPLRPATARPAL